MKKFSSKTKIIAMTSLTIAALAATMCASFAWFTTINPSTKIDTITGSMDISLTRMSAIKYVYPFFEGSDSFVDYTKEGTVKEYVIQEKDRESIPSFTLEGKDFSSFSDGIYLIGDSNFNGEKDTDFSLDKAIRFSSSNALNNVTISKNSVFALIKVKTEEETKNVSLIHKLNTTGSSDSVTANENVFLVKKAGFYTLKIDSDDKVSIIEEKRSDDAILEMTTLDPTYAKLNGQKAKEAIPSQNTLMIFDVELAVKNQTRDFILNCDVKRKGVEDKDITNKLSPYLSYHAQEANTIKEDVYSTLHTSLYDKSEPLKTKSFADNSDTSLNIFQSPIKNDQKDSTLIHLYLTIDYNPDKASFFFREENLGKAFTLQRDFTFYFSVKQSIAGATEGK